MAGIRTEQLTFTYPNDKTHTQVINGVDLQVQDQEFLILLGPSGCGKSTMLRLIAGLEAPTGGTVYFDDQNMTGVEPMKRNVAMVFQNFALYPHLNVFKNMAFPLNTMKMPAEEVKERVEETARILDITHILNRKPRALSGGQRQRVALGRAMVRNPVAFLLDEPLSNLDVKMRQELREEIIRLHKELQKTFIYVTHDQTEAMMMGDRLAVMNEGVICQIDTPQEVYNHPNCLFVAEFVGSPKMNFFASRISFEEERPQIRVFNLWIEPKEDEEWKVEGEGSGKQMRVIAGIRPEDFRLAETVPDKEDQFCFTARVNRAVPMGSGVHVEATYEGATFLAVIQNGSIIMNGQELELCLDPKKIHLFDPDTNKSMKVRR